jgi:LacI family transcriptional regulator
MIADEIEEALESLLKGKAKPDAVFTAADRITTLCFGMLKKMNLKKELGFTGFTNTNLGELFCPSLTAIRQPAFEIGQTATEFLIQIIESKRPVTEFETKVLETELIIRDSSKRKV